MSHTSHFLVHLNEETRYCMLWELCRDVTGHRVYYNPYLPKEYYGSYHSILHRCFLEGDAETLAHELGELMSCGRGTTDSLKHVVGSAWGEFNRYYMRGLCQRAMEENLSRLVISRATAWPFMLDRWCNILGVAVKPNRMLSALRARRRQPLTTFPASYWGLTLRYPPPAPASAPPPDHAPALAG